MKFRMGVLSLKLVKCNNGSYFLLAFLVYTLILTFLFRNLDFTKMWGYGDLNPFSKQLIQWALYAWKEGGLGCQYISLNYLGLLLQAFLTITLGGIVAQKIVILLPFLASFTTMYYLSRKLFNLTEVICFASAVLYSVNPVTVMAFVAGGFGSLMVYSLIPIIFYLFTKFLETHKVRYLLSLVVISPFFWNIYDISWVFLVLLPSLTMTKLFFVHKRKEVVKVTLIGFIILATCYLLVFLPTLIQLYFSYQKIGRGLGVRISGDVLWNYRDVNIFNLLRLAGNHGSAQPYLGYNSLNYFTWAGFVLEMLAVASLLIFKRIVKQQNTLQLAFLSSWISLLISVTLLIIIKRFPYIVNILPVMSTLRNPARLMYIIAFDVIILATISITYLYNTITRLRRGIILAKLLIFTILLVLVFIYNMPAMDGTYGLSIRSESYLVNSKYYHLKKILETIYPDYRNHRILIVPFDYSSLMDLRAILPNYFGLTIGPLINASALKDIYELTVSSNPYKSHVLALFDVKLVVIDKKFHGAFEHVSWYQRLKKLYGAFIFGYHHSYFVGGNTSVLKRFYSQDPHFKVIYEDNNFAIFENAQNTSRVYIVPKEIPLRSIATVMPLTENLIPNPLYRENLRYWKFWPGKCCSLYYDESRGHKVLLLRDCDNNNKVWSLAYVLVSVKGGREYKLSVLVKFLNRISGSHVKILWYNQTKNFSDRYAFKADYIKLHSMDITIGKWYHVEKVLKAPLTAKVAKIMFLVGPEPNTSMLIDNASFVEVTKKINLNIMRYPLMYVRKDPTTIVIRIHSSKPFALVLAESYDPLWEARVYKDGKLVEKVRSDHVYGAINGFWINRTGNLTIVIRYVPQDWFELGLKISASTFALCILYLVWDWRRGRGDRWVLWVEERFRDVFRSLKKVS